MDYTLSNGRTASDLAYSIGIYAKRHFEDDQAIEAQEWATFCRNERLIERDIRHAILWAMSRKPYQSLMPLLKEIRNELR